TATAGNAQVALSWNASTGATGYRVKRSTTSGGPYAVVGSPSTTSFTDTTVTNGTPYFYVVSAVDSAGESANSSQVSATPSRPAHGGKSRRRRPGQGSGGCSRRRRGSRRRAPTVGRPRAATRRPPLHRSLPRPATTTTGSCPERATATASRPSRARWRARHPP